MKLNRRPYALYNDLPGSLRFFGVPLDGDPGTCVQPVNLRLHSSGYWCVSFQGESTYLHRLVVRWKLGRPIADGKVARHAVCGFSPCTNPWHLEEGTPLQNMADEYAHGTRVMGERHPQCKLTDVQVREISDLLSSGGLSESVIGNRFGVSRGTVNDIRRGRRRSAALGLDAKEYAGMGRRT